MRERLNDILSHHTDQPLEKIQNDTDRDFFMSGEEAREYGIVDKVIVERAIPEENSLEKGPKKAPEGKDD